MHETFFQFTAIKQLELVLVQQPVLVELEQLLLEVLVRFQLLVLELLLEQQRHNRLRHSQCCCRMSYSRFQLRHNRHSLELEHCMCCNRHSLELVRCMCCNHHSLELQRCMCCSCFQQHRMSHSLELERCMCCSLVLERSSLSGSKNALHALACSVCGSVLACSTYCGQLQLQCWSASVLPTRTRYSNVALFYPS